MSKQATTATPADVTVKHIVMWDLRGETATQKHENAVFLKHCFEDLAGKIPGLLQAEVGIDISAVDYACDVVLYMEFASAAALTAYATHPEHLRVKQALADLRIARHQVDYLSPARLAEV